MGLHAVASEDREPIRGLRFAPTVVLVTVASPPDAGHSDHEHLVDSEATSTNRRPSDRRTRNYLVVGVVVILAVVLSAYVVMGGLRTASSSGSTGTVLIPFGTGYSMVIGQYNGINFDISHESRITGLLNSSHGIQIYILTPSEFAYLVKNLSVSGYVWTSGVVAFQQLYQLNVAVQPGQWVLSFVNPNVSWPTGVGFYSDVVLAPV